MSGTEMKAETRDLKSTTAPERLSERRGRGRVARMARLSARARDLASLLSDIGGSSGVLVAIGTAGFAVMGALAVWWRGLVDLQRGALYGAAAVMVFWVVALVGLAVMARYRQHQRPGALARSVEASERPNVDAGERKQPEPSSTGSEEWLDWHGRRRSAVLAVVSAYIRASVLSPVKNQGILKEMDAPARFLWTHYLKPDEREPDGQLAEAIGVVRTVAEEGTSSFSPERLNSAVRAIGKLSDVHSLVPPLEPCRILEIRPCVDSLSNSWSYQQHTGTDRLNSALIARRFIVLQVTNVGPRALSGVIAKCRFSGDQSDFEGLWSEESGTHAFVGAGSRLATLGVQDPRLLVVGQCIETDRLI